MDSIGYILEPQNVVSWVWLAWLIGGIVTLIAAILIGVSVFKGANRYDRAWDTINSVLVVLFAGLVLTVLMGVFPTFSFDAERTAAATVLKIENELGIDILTYTSRWHVVEDFTAISEDGGAILGRTSYEGDKIFVLSLTK